MARECARVLAMSRRSRRNNAAGERRWLGKSVVGLLVLGLLALAAGYGMLRRYLHSDSFRLFLSARASQAAGVIGEFAPFEWDGLAVNTENFQAKGVGMITSLRADGLHTEVGLGGVQRGVWEIRDSSVRRLEVAIDVRKSAALPEEGIASAKPDIAKSAPQHSWLPREAEVQGVDVRELVVKAALEKGLASISGMSLHAEQAGGKNSYRAEAKGGKILLPFRTVPELRLERARLRYQDGQAFLTDATLAAWSKGSIHSTGEWDLKSQRYTFQGDAREIQFEDLLSADWAKRLTGEIASDFTLDNPSGSPRASGKMTVRNGAITALPMLDALATYIDTCRFRNIPLNEAKCDWRWQQGELSLSHLVLASEGLIRLEGDLTVRGEVMDGNFRLGIPPGTLARIPGAETDVFVLGERGLLWAPLHLTGNLDHPKEDLSERLIAAAGQRVIEQIPQIGEKVLEIAQSLLGDASAESAAKDHPAEDKKAKTVRKVTGILRGVLGGGEPAVKEDEAQ